MHFVFQALTWGFLLTLVPLLIHLINMLRHQRVRWAAMDFLLQSYKRHRRWVWLKQLILLLLRMAAVALIVMLMAQWDPRGSWLQRLGGRVTHHYVVLDDSYSMSERQGAGSVFETATQAVARIGAEAARQNSPQRFTLILMSEAARARGVGEGTGDAGAPVAEGQASPASAPPAGAGAAAAGGRLSNEIVDAEFGSRLEEVRRALVPSEQAVGPRPALELVAQMLDEGRNEKSQVYVISDFRVRPWEAPAEIKQLLQEIERREASVHLVSATRQAQGNLGIESVVPDGSSRAAGVPLFVNVTVRNFGDTPASKVQVRAKTVQFDPSEEGVAEPGKATGQEEELPIEEIESIGPGSTAVARVQVVFTRPGRQVVEVSIPDDNIAADNRRWCVLELEEGEPVLALEDRLQDRNAQFLSILLRPGGQTNTGLRPEIQGSAYLRETTPDELRRYSTVYLFGADQLDARAVENLETYVREGGGLAIFMGPGVNLATYNDRLYRDGEGALPLPLGRDWLLAPPSEEETPDVEVVDPTHPVFRDLLRGRNPIVRMIKVARYIEPAKDWKAEEHPDVEVLATLHNGMPLAVERRFGDGRVFLFLSTYAPDWNDLALGPNVLMALNLQAHLASGRRADDSRLVGAPYELPVDGDRFQERIDFVMPGAEVVQVQAAAPEGAAGLSARLTEPTARSGVYEAWSEDLEGVRHVDREAYNVDPAEGELRRIEATELLAALDPVKPAFRQADELYDIVADSGFNPIYWLLGLLILLLLGEQLLAYLLSYHPGRGQGVAPPRGAAGHLTPGHVLAPHVARPHVAEHASSGEST